MDTLLYYMMRVLIGFFLIGVVGCLFVIPFTAVELLVALFQPDEPEDGAPRPPNDPGNSTIMSVS